MRNFGGGEPIDVSRAFFESPKLIPRFFFLLRQFFAEKNHGPTLRLGRGIDRPVVGRRPAGLLVKSEQRERRQRHESLEKPRKKFENLWGESSKRWERVVAGPARGKSSSRPRYKVL